MEWEAVRHAYTKHADRVLHHLILSGQISPKARGLGCHLYLSGEELGVLRRDAEARSTMVHDLLVGGWVKFRSSLLLGGWDERCNLRLSGYFVNTCVMVSANVIRRWRKERELLQVELPFDDEHPAGYQVRDDDCAELRMVIARADARRRLAALIPRMDPVLANAVRTAYENDCRSWAEVAELVGVGTRQLEGRLYRFRQKLRRLEEEDIDGER